MNFITQLFNKSKIKMEKMTILLAMYAHFQIVKDDARLAATAKAINLAAEPFIGKLPEAVKTDSKPAEQQKKQEEKKPAEKVNLVDKNTPGAKKEESKPAEKPAEKPTEKVEETTEEVDETLIEVYPFHVCSVNNGKHDKRININAPRKFKVFTTDEAKAAANNAYPTAEEFDLVIDEAWDMAMEGKSNKEIVAMLKPEIGDYYPELKGDSDWYGKLVNPLVASMNLIRTAFGYKATDTTVQVTRPSEAGLTLTRENDVHVIAKAAEAKKAEPAKTVEPLKTTQKGKVEERPGKDEEAQEKETVEETTEETTEEVAEEVAKPAEKAVEEKDANKPPKVNKFDEFNALETLIFDKYREGATLAAGIKDEAGRKAVQAEKRDESRMLIASAFEDEPWTEKIDGKWNPLLLSYHNDIVAQISANRAKWPK